MKPIFNTTILTILLIISGFYVSFAQTDWTKYENNPVLNPGPAGAWDNGFVGNSTVLFDGDIYRMWFGNFANNKHERIGYATSADGINWDKYNDSTTTSTQFAESDPVLIPGEAGEWDDGDVATPAVILVDSIYHMWYAGGYNKILSIGHVTSTDGINWERDQNNPVLIPGTNGAWDDFWLYAPCVVFDGSIYHMWYEASNGSQVRIGHATSQHPDSSWIKDPTNPVLSPGVPGSWDYPRVDVPKAIYIKNTFHIWYAGGEWFSWHTGYASSQESSIWTKYDDLTTTSQMFAKSDPVIIKGQSGTWDDYLAASCSVIFDSTESVFQMWYTGGNGVGNGKIGYATAPVSYNALFEYAQDSLTAQFTDKSIGIITTWLWKFGDDSSSTNRNPTHIYNEEGTYTITLTVSGAYGSDSSSKIINVVTAIKEKSDNILKGYLLDQNYPNPFNPLTTIGYTVKTFHGRSPLVNLSIYNLLGQKVATLVDKKQKTGSYQVEWDATGFATGIYYYKLTTGDFQQVKKMVLIK